MTRKYTVWSQREKNTALSLHKTMGYLNIARAMQEMFPDQAERFTKASVAGVLNGIKYKRVKEEAEKQDEDVMAANRG